MMIDTYPREIAAAALKRYRRRVLDAAAALATVEGHARHDTAGWLELWDLDDRLREAADQLAQLVGRPGNARRVAAHALTCGRFMDTVARVGPDRVSAFRRDAFAAAVQAFTLATWCERLEFEVLFTD